MFTLFIPIAYERMHGVYISVPFSESRIYQKMIPIFSEWILPSPEIAKIVL